MRSHPGWFAFDQMEIWLYTTKAWCLLKLNTAGKKRQDGTGMESGSIGDIPIHMEFLSLQL